MPGPAAFGLGAAAQAPCFQRLTRSALSGAQDPMVARPRHEAICPATAARAEGGQWACTRREGEAPSNKRSFREGPTSEAMTGDEETGGPADESDGC